MSDGISQDFTIINKLGLHARASAKLVKIANTFGAEVTIIKDGQAVNGKSILGLMTLAAAKGTQITVRCTGADQDAALTAIGACINDRFGEGE